MDTKINIEELSYEDAINQLEEIIRTLESGNVNLEDSLRLYENAICLYRHCSDVLNKAELKITEFKNGKNEVEVEI